MNWESVTRLPTSSNDRSTQTGQCKMKNLRTPRKFNEDVVMLEKIADYVNRIANAFTFKTYCKLIENM